RSRRSSVATRGRNQVRPLSREVAFLLSRRVRVQLIENPLRSERSSRLGRKIGLVWRFRRTHRKVRPLRANLAWHSKLFFSTIDHRVVQKQRPSSLQSLIPPEIIVQEIDLRGVWINDRLKLGISHPA